MVCEVNDELTADPGCRGKRDERVSDRCHDDRSKHYQRKHGRLPPATGCFGSEVAGNRGVQVIETRRATDVFIERQATIQLGTKNFHDTRNQALIAVESTVGMMGENALTTYFDEFYNSWYELSANAQDPAQRFATYNRTVEVASAIRRSAEELTKSQQNTNEEIARLTEETNLLIERGAKQHRHCESRIDRTAGQ